MAFAVGVGARGVLAAGLRARVSPRRRRARAALVRGSRRPSSSPPAPRHSSPTSPSTRAPLRRRPSRLAPTIPAASPPTRARRRLVAPERAPADAPSRPARGVVRRLRRPRLGRRDRRRGDRRARAHRARPPRRRVLHAELRVIRCWELRSNSGGTCSRSWTPRASTSSPVDRDGGVALCLSPRQGSRAIGSSSTPTRRATTRYGSTDPSRTSRRNPRPSPPTRRWRKTARRTCWTS